MNIEVRAYGKTDADSAPRMFYSDEEMGSPGYHIGHFGCFDDPRFVFMLYTGLKDKNGVKIWEGDIVRGVNFYGEPQTLVTVVWLQRIYLKDLAKPFTWNSLLPEEGEVVGNIYEHSELLK